MISVLGGGFIPRVTITEFYERTVSYPYEGESVIIPPRKAPEALPLITIGRSFRDYVELHGFLESYDRRRLLEADLAWSQVTGRDMVDVTVLPLAGSTRASEVERIPEPYIRVSWVNVQVAGVDELDFVKTNGRLIAVVGGSGLRSVYLVDVNSKSVVNVIRLPESESVKGLFLNDWKLVIVSESKGGVFKILNLDGVFFSRYNVNVTIRILDIANPLNPLLIREIGISGSLVDGRVYRSVVYLILNQPAIIQGIPLVPLVDLMPIRPEAIIASSYEAERYITIIAINVSDTTYNVLSVIGGPATRIYMSYDKLYVISTRKPSIMEVYALALRELAELLGEDRGYDIKQMIERGDVKGALKLANKILSTMNQQEVLKLLEELEMRLKSPSLSPSDKTTVLVFKVRGVEVKPIGSIEVKGSLLDQFALEEYEGKYLVIATTVSNYYVQVVLVHVLLKEVEQLLNRTSTTISIPVCYPHITRCEHITIILPSRIREVLGAEPRLNILLNLIPMNISNSVYVVDIDTLKLVGLLEGIALGERIYSARLVKNILFLVTFRIIDPLFAVDISNPENLRILGFLKIHGFSEYLHPLPDNLLLGIGLEDRAKLKVSLFDTTNPANIIQISSLILENADSLALRDHHAITVDLEYIRIYIPVQLFKQGIEGIAVISFENKMLKLNTILSHSDAKRSIYIGRDLYTISHSGIIVYDIETFREKAIIVFS